MLLLTQLEQVTSVWITLNYTSKMYKSLVLRPKQEHIDVCKKYPVQCPAACGVEVPRKKVCFFVCSPIAPIHLVFKNHTKCKVEHRLHFSNLSDYPASCFNRTSKTSIISCLSFLFVSHPERSGNSCFYFSNLGASNQEY